MFTDADYDSIDFKAIHNYFKSRYSYVETKTVGIIGVGDSYFVGHNEDQLVKVDVYYTDPFIRHLIEEEKIRMSSLRRYCCDETGHYRSWRKEKRLLGFT